MSRTSHRADHLNGVPYSYIEHGVLYGNGQYSWEPTYAGLETEDGRREFLRSRAQQLDALNATHDEIRFVQRSVRVNFSAVSVIATSSDYDYIAHPNPDGEDG